jgi:hypothetical protein
MLKLKADIPMRRIQTKKMILDMLAKKRELEIKERSVSASDQLVGTTSDLLRAIFNRLDQSNIHPIVDTSVLESECLDIVDSPKSLSDSSCDSESENRGDDAVA